MESEPMKLTALYARVSTIEQKEQGHSIENQIKRLNEYCSYKGYGKTKLYVDEGKSGSTFKKRPQAMQLLKDLEDGLVDRIVINKLSRFSRNLREFLSFIEDIEKYDCQFISLSEDINTKTASGRLFLKIIMSVLEFEREVTSERTQEIQMGLAKQNKIITRLPFGYKPIKKKIRGKVRVAEWVVDKKQAIIVNELFREADRMSIRQLSLKYGVPSSSIKDILSNEAYLGIKKYKDSYYKIDVEPILTPEQYFLINPDMKDKLFGVL